MYAVIFSFILLLSLSLFSLSIHASELGLKPKFFAKISHGQVALAVSIDAGGNDYRINIMEGFAVLPYRNELYIAKVPKSKRFLNTIPIRKHLAMYGYFKKNKLLV